MIFTLISVTVILNLVKSEPHVLTNPFILFTVVKVEYFENRWSVSLPNELIENEEAVCKSVNNSKIFDRNDYTSRSTWNQRKEALPICGIERESGSAELNLVCQGKKFRASLLSCEWTSETSRSGWFYLGTADNFDGYILLICENVRQEHVIKLFGLVMEFLNLRQVSENGQDIFQKIFKNYVKNLLLNKESQASSSENELLIFEQKFQFSKLCVSVQQVILQNGKQDLSDDYLTMSFVNEKFSLLLNVESSSKSKIKTFFSKLPLLTHKVVKCLFTRPYLVEYTLLRHPMIRNQFFVIYDNYTKITLFQSSTDLYVSSKW